ncbi:polysaccharide pyruvyl transferase family protein [Mycolicibacterium tokaiense]|uniref:Colanic acid biosynthesis protein n=2 Tax=Mycolicibacterium tokaiense TaxID=39695 RepID=A0A378TKG5_9MYCO|nr:polysaccharide pyruvyl transferase family protein [Mycolicibacterium tokaiense]STZ60667.1 colanic acid biosynthesis protein [Mycolicibacterium tokaiense]
MTMTHLPGVSGSSRRPSARPGGRTILFLGTHGQANVGDELLLDTFLAELGREHTYLVNSYDPDATIAQLRDRFDVTAFHTSRQRLTLLRNLLRCNVIVFGGGNILKELYGSVGRWRYSTLAMVLALVLLGRLAGKPVLMANVGIGPVDSVLGRLFVRVILRLVWVISVRDEGSLRAALSLGCSEHKVRLVPDAVWVRNPGSFHVSHVSPVTRDPHRPLRIALNLNKDVDVADEWELFLDRLVQALNLVAQAHRVEFHALPMQCAFKSGTDLDVLQAVLARLHAPVCIHAPDDHHEVASIISDCDLVVSERLHAIVMSVVLGRPVVALPYDIKVRHLVTQLGIKERSFDVSAALDPERLAAAILDTVADSGRETDRLAAVAAAKRHDAARGFSALRSWVAAPTRRWELPDA